MSSYVKGKNVQMGSATSSNTLHGCDVKGTFDTR